MAHELETVNGEASFVSRRIPAWHRLGQIVDADVLSADDALKLAHLDGWDVKTFPMITATHAGYSAVPDRVATVRRNPSDPSKSDVLGVVSDEYHVIQNEQAFAFLDALVQDGIASYETAGSLRGGRQVFVTMKLPDHVLIGGTDRVDWYLSCATSHDGSMAFSVLPTPVRVVCANTLSFALSGAQQLYRVLHTRGAAPRVEDAREALQLSYKMRDSWNDAMGKLLDTSMDTKAFDAFIAEHVIPMPKPDEDKQVLARVVQRVERQRGELRLLFREADTQDFGRWTRYAAFNAVSEWTEWVRPGTEAAGERSSTSVLLGSTAQLRGSAARQLLTV